jgi:L-ascorbate metabolism protein UlaG (beta-lactamase superfamily)
MRRSSSLILLTVAVLSACVSVGYDGPASDHFDGRRFFNPNGVRTPGMADLLRWRFHRDEGFWRDWVDDPPISPPPTRLGGGELRVTFIGHATTLVQVDGINVLIDPVYSDSIGPALFSVERHRDPGIAFEDLPPIDVVLISHDHFDHLDLPTLRRLALEHHPRIVAGLGVDTFLGDEGIDGAVGLDWWQSHRVGDVEVVATPAQHGSRRSVRDENRRLWVGFVLEGPSGVVFYAGDTGYAEHFAEVRRRYGPPRLALLPVGMFRPRWFMCGLHLSPDEAAHVHRDLDSETSVAVHWGTFALADDGELEPIDELAHALAFEERRRFWVLEHGEGRDVPWERAHPRRAHP